ncbi:hypothetical protein GCM10023194_34180 [Planotetraspora phitsanulokensis]|uniref:DUF7158 domain-containing protein n=1 Tax=Planotetraspora phitsanulokensis TaxID=575192 RepID=UPI0031E83919
MSPAHAASPVSSGDEVSSEAVGRGHGYASPTASPAGHGHGHRHAHAASPADGEPSAPGVGPVLGWLDGRPLPRADLDRRLAAVRGRPRSSALPEPGSAEDRQLTRWVAQVMLTELLCEAEAAERGLDTGGGAPPVRLDQRAAVELGSITAAAFEGSGAVRAVYAAVTADVTVPGEQAAAYAAATARPPAEPEWRLSTADGDFDAAPGTLPARLAAALAETEPGQTVTVDGLTVTLLGTREPGNPPEPGDRLLDAARRLAFVRWLDHARAHRLRLVPGLEHPGDPAQPDNHHRH